jgi:CcmD family protein
MSDLIYLYSAYTIVWAGLLIYLIKLHITQRRLKKEIDLLREIINGKKSN